MTMDLDPRMTSLDMLGYGEPEMPGDSGLSKTETAEDVDYRESFTITVREAPGGE